MIGVCLRRMSASTTSVVDRVWAVAWSGSLLAGMLLMGCGGAPESSETSATAKDWMTLEGETQGTTFRFVWNAAGAREVRQEQLDSILTEVDDAVNLWNPQSDLVRINAWPLDSGAFTWRDSSQILTLLWLRSEEIWSASDGAFDPTVGPLVELWGFGLSKSAAVTPERLQAARSAVGFVRDVVSLDEIEGPDGVILSEVKKEVPGVLMDFNAIAQGYTVDLVADFLRERGVQHGMVEIGGEVRCWGKNDRSEDWHIAIDAPIAETGTDRVFDAIALVQDAAICTSGSYRKFREVGGKRLSHAIDPRTGNPVDHGLLSATIRAHTAATADALATACLVMGPEEGRAFIEGYRQEHPEERIDAYFLIDNGEGGWTSWMTEGWKGNLIPTDSKQPA